MTTKNKQQRVKISLQKFVTITILIFSSLLLFSMMMASLIPLCGAIANFFKGLFGIAFYGIVVGAIVVTSLLLAGKRINLKTRYIVDLALLYFSIIWLVHLVTSNIYIAGNSYGEYLACCFNYTQTPSFGGLFGGIFVYPFAKVSSVLAYIIFIAGIVLTSFFAVNVLYKPSAVRRPQHTNITESEKEEIISEEPIVAKPQKPITNSMDILYGNHYPTPQDTPEKTQREQSFDKSLTAGSTFLDLFPASRTKKTYDTAPTSKLDLADTVEKPATNPIFDKPQTSEYDYLNLDKIAKERAEEEAKPIVKDEKQEQLEQAKRDFEALRSYPKAPNDVPIIDGDTYGKQKQGISLDENIDEVKTEQEDFDNQTNESDIDDNSDIANKNDTTTNEQKITFGEKPFVTNDEQKGFQGVIKVDEDLTPDADYHRYRPYNAPPIDLLNNVPVDKVVMEEDFEKNAQILEQTLNEFKIDAKVENIVKGPSVTRYELSLAAGISIKKISNLTEDITRRLSAIGSVRLETTISGKDLFGIEVPNKKTEIVTLRSIIESDSYNKPCNGLRFALGIDIGGQFIAPDLADMPHLLVAGSTGTGKSVCLNSLIISLMYKYSPEELRFILVDPKRVEFFIYNKMPHLMVDEVISEHEKAITAFTWAIDEMERRYSLFANIGAKDIASYNRLINPEITQKLPRIVMVVDELSELIMYNKGEVEQRIKSLSAKARAAGIHLVLATQRPSVDVITGVIKANLPSRIALRVFSTADSKTILDQGGPEKLIGKGDMLIVTGNTPKPVRLQGALVTMSEVERVVEFIKSNNELYFDENVENKILRNKSENSIFEEDSDLDPLFMEALHYIIESGAGVASISMLQRRFSIGYNRAGKIIEDMVQKHFVSGYDGSKSRKVLITKEEFEQLYNE